MKAFLAVLLCVAMMAPVASIAAIGGPDCCSQCNCAYWSCLATCLIGIAIDQLISWIWNDWSGSNW